MPHATHAYPFEAKVEAFARTLCERFTADGSLRSFLLVLDAEGSVRSLTFADASASWRQMSGESARSATPHLFYDPLDDGMEYVWLGWHRIERTAMERLIGQPFEGADFIPDPKRARAPSLEPANTFPASWGVMF